MTDIDLDAIEARANAATEGPWLAYDERSDLREENPDVNPMWVVAHMEPDGVNWVRDIADIGGGEQDETDAEFIAHARTDVPALVAEVRRLREESAKATTWHMEALDDLQQEAEVRERIAADIEAHIYANPLTTQERWQASGLRAAARIARGVRHDPSATTDGGSDD